MKEREPTEREPLVVREMQFFPLFTPLGAVQPIVLDTHGQVPLVAFAIYPFLSYQGASYRSQVLTPLDEDLGQGEQALNEAFHPNEEIMIQRLLRRYQQDRATNNYLRVSTPYIYLCLATASSIHPDPSIYGEPSKASPLPSIRFKPEYVPLLSLLRFQVRGTHGRIYEASPAGEIETGIFFGTFNPPDMRLPKRDHPYRGSDGRYYHFTGSLPAIIPLGAQIQARFRIERG